MQNSYSKLIVAVFLLLQFVILFVYGYTPYPDCEGYIPAATEALGQGSAYPSVVQLHSLDFIWNLGSINAVELSLWLTGSVMPLLVVYTILKALTAWLVYLIARRMANEPTAMLALLIYVLYPANYGASTSVLSELPFIFFVVLAIWLILVRRKSLAGGAVLAIANWFRPMGLVFLVAVGVVIVVGKITDRGWNSTARRRRYEYSLPPVIDGVKAVIGYVAMILIIGFATRAYCGRFIYQAQTGWMALMQYSWDNDHEQEPDKSLFYGGDPMLVPDAATTDGVERDDHWRGNFRKWITGGNAVEYLSQMPHKVAATYVSDNVNMCTFVPEKRSKEYMYEEVSLPRLVADFPHYNFAQWLTAANLVVYYLLLILYLISLFTIRRRKNNPVEILTFAIVLIGTLVLMLFGHGEARFHQPFMPFIIVTVAAMITSRLTRAKR